MEEGSPGWDSALRNYDHDSGLHLLALGLAGAVEPDTPHCYYPPALSLSPGAPCSYSLHLLALKDITREQGP